MTHYLLKVVIDGEEDEYKFTRKEEVFDKIEENVKENLSKKMRFTLCVCDTHQIIEEHNLKRRIKVYFTFEHEDYKINLGEKWEIEDFDIGEAENIRVKIVGGNLPDLEF